MQTSRPRINDFKHAVVIFGRGKKDDFVTA